MTTPTLDQTIEAIAAYESWKEDTLLSDPDVSLTAYIRVLEAGQPDPRIAEIHSLAVHALDTRGVNDPSGLSPSDEDRAYNALKVIAAKTDTIYRDLETIQF